MAKAQLTSAQKAKRRRKITREIRGAVFSLLAVIGVMTLISLAAGGIRNALSQENDKEKFSRLVEPLVALDPVPFDSIDAADNKLLMESAVWATYENEDVSKYQKNGADHLIVPVTDIARYFTKLYGSNANMIRRKNFTVDSLTYEYDANRDAYILPATSWIGRYTAKVTGIKTSGGTKVLTVGYVRYDPNSGIGENTSEEIVKYMEYVLVKEESDWHVYAVRYPVVDD